MKKYLLLTNILLIMTPSVIFGQTPASCLIRNASGALQAGTVRWVPNHAPVTPHIDPASSLFSQRAPQQESISAYAALLRALKTRTPRNERGNAPCRVDLITGTISDCNRSDTNQNIYAPKGPAQQTQGLDCALPKREEWRIGPNNEMYTICI